MDRTNTVPSLVGQNQSELEISVHLGGNPSKLQVLGFVNQRSSRVFLFRYQKTLERIPLQQRRSATVAGQRRPVEYREEKLQIVCDLSIAHTSFFGFSFPSLRPQSPSPAVLDETIPVPPIERQNLPVPAEALAEQVHASVIVAVFAFPLRGDSDA